MTDIFRNKLELRHFNLFLSRNEGKINYVAGTIITACKDYSQAE